MGETLRDVHVRMRPELAQSLERAIELMAKSARVPVSRAAGAAALLETGIREYLRKRETKT